MLVERREGNMSASNRARPLLAVSALLCAVLAGGAIRRVQETCGPFTDVSAMYCPYILEIYYVGISAGTSATTFSPDAPITRGQAAVLAAKTLNQSLARSSRRAALGRWSSAIPWVAWFEGVGTTPLPNPPVLFGPMASDGTDIWVGDTQGVSRFRASDGRFLESWTTDQQPAGIVIGVGLVLVTGWTTTSGPASFFVIDPRLPAGAAQKAASIPAYTSRVSFDGGSVWAVNTGISIISPVSPTSWQVTNVTAGFQFPIATVFDGQNTWVSDSGPCALLQLDSQGAIQRTVSLGQHNSCNLSNGSMLFDGRNILVPFGSGLAVVRPSDGSVIANLSVADGIVSSLAFDGERLLVVANGPNQSIFPSMTLLRAADYSVIQSQLFSDFGPSFGSAVSDGLNFWITAQFPGGPSAVLARY
jgi:S-layer homology domain